MVNLKTVKLIDDVRNDALILMKSRPDLNYLDAFEIAQKNLIGEEKITNFEFQPFTVSFDNVNYQSNQENVNDDKNYASDFDTDEEFKSIVGANEIVKYSKEQLKQYMIAHKMGADISLFMNEKFTPKQIKFLSVMLVSGKPIEKYLNDYNFDPAIAFLEMVNIESQTVQK